jgi:dUTP pyrophosphatase
MWFLSPRLGDAGYDLRVCDEFRDWGSTIAKIHTGVMVEIPEGYVGLIKARSSWAQKGLNIFGGVIDSSYRGEIIIITNYIDEFPLPTGTRIAQLVIVPHLSGATRVEEFGETVRGISGFGSTGDK